WPLVPEATGTLTIWPANMSAPTAATRPAGTERTSSRAARAATARPPAAATAPRISACPDRIPSGRCMVSSSRSWRRDGGGTGTLLPARELALRGHRAERMMRDFHFPYGGYCTDGSGREERRSTDL